MCVCVQITVGIPGPNRVGLECANIEVGAGIGRLGYRLRNGAGRPGQSVDSVLSIWATLM